MAVVMAESLFEFCNFTTDSASETGGCILFNSTNGTVKKSHFSGCKGKSGGTLAVNERATLQLEAVTIDESSSTDHDGALYMSKKSDLLVRNSVITHLKSGGIYCSERSRIYLDSVMISYCYSSFSSLSGCVAFHSCNVIMDNITITGLLSEIVIAADDSTFNIYNTLAHDEGVLFFFTGLLFTHKLLEL